MTNNHTFFDDDGQPIEKVKNLDKKLGTAKELLDRKYNRLKIEDLLPEMAVDEETLKEAAKETKRKYHELESR